MLPTHRPLDKSPAPARLEWSTSNHCTAQKYAETARCLALPMTYKVVITIVQLKLNEKFKRRGGKGVEQMTRCTRVK